MPYHKGKRQHDRGVIPEANKKETAARCAGKREDGDIRPFFAFSCSYLENER